jgi:hypothetical protein
MLLYALTILESAFLLFQVQPIIAKIILPWFGGSAAVWTVCLLFFQLALLAGYAYAHALIRYCKPRVQMLIHASLLLLSVVALPTRTRMEARAARRSNLGNCLAAGRQNRHTLFPALHHRSAAAGMVCAQLQGRHPLPALCAFECRFHVRAAQLSVPV